MYSGLEQHITEFLFLNEPSLRSVCLTHIFQQQVAVFHLVEFCSADKKKERFCNDGCAWKSNTFYKETTSIGFWGSSLEEPLSQNAQTHKEDCKWQDFSACTVGMMCVWETSSSKRSGRRTGKLLWMLLACGHHYSQVISVTLTLYLPLQH